VTWNARRISLAFAAIAIAACGIVSSIAFVDYGNPESRLDAATEPLSARRATRPRCGFASHIQSAQWNVFSLGGVDRHRADATNFARTSRAKILFRGAYT
jgi:hypothetical protein